MTNELRKRTAKAVRPGSVAPPPPPREPAKTRSATLMARLKYRFDLALARGPLIVIGYLGLIMLAIIVISALIVTIFNLNGEAGLPNHPDFVQAFWQSLIRVVDTGGEDTDTGWWSRIVALLVTLSGIFLAGSLIGLIANSVDQQIEKLRKGRSAVLETNHTLVLGWSPRLPVILAELVTANASSRREAFVVLAARPKDAMEDELRRLVPDTKTTRVVCRTGDVGSVKDLQLVNVDGARSVIVLAGEEGDAGVVKAVLAVRSIDPKFERTRVVAELNDHGHAETLRMLTDGRIATVEADDVITQVTAQACHQNGLAGVFRNLLDFGGDEIYFNRAPELTGHTYREAVRAFEHACVIGLFRRGQVLLNPAADFVFADGDEVIAIAADNDRVAFTGFLDDLAVERVTGVEAKEPPQRIALIGWSALGVAVLRELDRFVSAGSVVDLLVVRSVFAPEEIALPEYTHCAVNLHPIDAGPKALLDVLGRNRYDLAIVLGYRRTMTASEADAQSMLTLLALSRAFDSDAARPRVVAEMLDHSNVEIAQTTGVDDFIVSDELSSLMMAQLSERLDLQAVFTELFAPDGCFVSLHPAVLYAPDHETTFASIVASAAERGATALGYRVGRAPAVLNPRKSARIRLGAGDQVLVLAPRESRPLVPAPELERRPAPA